MTIVAMKDCASLRRKALFDSLCGQSVLRVTLDDLMAAGATLHRTGCPEDALALFEWTVELDPGYTNGWMAVAVLRAELGRPWAALLACNRAMELSPDDGDVLSNTAAVLLRLGDLPAAEFVARKAARFLSPDDERANTVLAKVFAKMQRLDEAAECFAKSRLLAALDPVFCAEYADVLIARRDYASARKILGDVLGRHPDATAARISLAYVEAALGNDAASYELLSAACRRDPEVCATWQPFLYSDFLAKSARLDPLRFRMALETAAVFECDWTRRDEFTRWLVASLARENLPSLDDEDAPFVALGLDIGPEARLRMARQVALRQASSVSGVEIHRRIRGHGERLRIGYLSGDMRTHPVGRLFSPVFALHDRTRFEIYVYHTGPTEDCEPRHRAERDADCFRDVERFPVPALAQLIAADGIDLLVDLSGYTLFSATAALALRPAPVQIHYLGFLGTLGAPHVDYSIADRYALPDNVRAYWSESIAFLPETMIVCDGEMAVRTAGRSRADYGLPQDGFVFACLNATWKIEPEIFAVWMRILKTVPGSVLWVFDGGLPRARENLMGHCEQSGLPASRLIFAERVTYADYLARYECVDLVLNTRTYSGNTTTLEALANDVPVLSFAGWEMQSRLAAGILSALGVADELVVPTAEAYECLAIELATSGSRMAAIRERIREGKRNSGLFRIDRRVRELEYAYETMWCRYQSGLPPADFSVPSAL